MLFPPTWAGVLDLPPPQSPFELAQLVESGLPIDSIVRLKERGLTFSEISDIVISPRTLKHRKARGESLSHDETDRVIRVARLIALAESIFGNGDKALLWLRSAQEGLNNRTPLSLLRTESGGRLIENMLWQIDEGLYA